MFITFEGIDGSGKTTVSKLFVDKLNMTRRLEEKDAIWICEPSASYYGQEIRRRLASKEETSNYTMAMLFALDREQHTKEIAKHLKAGRTVVCDRYVTSSYVYQGSSTSFQRIVGEGQTRLDAFVRQANLEALTPDIEFYLDIAPELALERCRSRGATDKHETLKALKENASRYHLRLPPSAVWIRVTPCAPPERLVEEIFQIYLTLRSRPNLLDNA